MMHYALQFAGLSALNILIAKQPPRKAMLHVLTTVAQLSKAQRKRGRGASGRSQIE